MADAVADAATIAGWSSHTASPGTYEGRDAAATDSKPRSKSEEFLSPLEWEAPIAVEDRVQERRGSAASDPIQELHEAPAWAYRAVAASHIKASIENELAASAETAEQDGVESPSPKAKQALRELLQVVVPILVDHPTLFYAASADGSGGVSLTLRSEHPRRASVIISADGCAASLIRVDERLRGEQAPIDRKELGVVSEVLDWLTTQDASSDA